MTTTSYAGEVPSNFALACTTSAAGMTIFVDGDRVRFHFENPAGFGNFPAYSGTVTESMFSLVRKAMKELRVFDGDIDFAWETRNCRVDEKRPLLISCSGLAEISNPQNIPKKLQLSVSSLSTSTEYVESLDIADAQVVHVNFGVNTAHGGHHFISMPFDSKHCARMKKVQGEGV
jgi:hypothetical protein